jgi:hypothetical protein
MWQAFGAWEAMASAQKLERELAEQVQRENERKMMRIIQMMHSALVASAFNGWHSITQQRIDNRRKVQSVLQVFANQTVSAAFAGWVARIEERVANRQKMAKACTLMLNIRLLSAIRGWADTVRNLMDLRDRLQFVVNLLMNRLLSSAFVGWQSNAALKAENRDKMMRVIKMMSNSLMANALSGWMRITDERIENRAKIDRVLKLMLNSVLAKAWNRWLVHHDTVTAAMKSAHSMLSWKLASALRAWQKFVQRHSRNTTAVNSTLMKITHRAVFAAFSGWRGAVEVILFHRDSLTAILKRFQNGALAAAWHSWDVWLNARFASMEALDRAVGILRNAKLSRAYRRWVEAVRRKLQHLEAIRHVLALIANRMLAGAYQGWRHTAAVQISHCQLLMKIVSRFQNRTVSAAFGGWRTWTAAQVETADRFGHAVRVLCNAKLASAYAGWQHAVATQLRLQGHVRRLLNRSLSMAFMSWLTRTRYQRSMEQRLQVVIARMSHMHAAVVCAQWAALAGCRARARQAAHEVAQQTKRRQLATSIRSWNLLFVAHFACRVFCARQAFEQWKETCALARHSRILLFAVTKFGGRKLNTVFRLWLWYHRAKCRQHDVVRQALSAMMNRALHRSFRKWAAVAPEQVHAFARATLVAEACLLRVLNDVQFGAYRRWHTHWRRMERLRAKAQHVQAARAETARREMMATWRRRYLQKLAIGAMRRRCCAEAVRQWRDAAQAAGVARERQTRMEAAAQRAVRRWLMRSVAAKLAHWRSCVAESVRVQTSTWLLRSKQWLRRWARIVKWDVGARSSAIMRLDACFGQRTTRSFYRAWGDLVQCHSLRRAHSCALLVVSGKRRWLLRVS